MEQLKPKHDHKLTDLIKIFIFGLVLLMPFLAWLPNAMYYGFNKYAQVGTEETYYNFYQEIINGKPNSLEHITYDSELYVSLGSDGYLELVSSTRDLFGTRFECNFEYTSNDILYISLIVDNEYELPVSVYANDGVLMFFEDAVFDNKKSVLWYDANSYTFLDLDIYADFTDNDVIYVKDFQCFNLTTIFGSGNEPTKQQFESMLTQDYYEYGNNYVIKDKGTNITWSMYNSWEDVWQTPLFNWTSQSILNTGLMAFVGVFGITNTAYISNLLTYELVIVSIYIVLDIVLAMYKALTHLLHKE